MPLRNGAHTWSQGGKHYTCRSSYLLFCMVHPTTRNHALITTRLKGPSIEIIIGCKADTAGPQDTWCLPKSLISHYSPFLKAACTRDFKEKEENRIVLADENSNIFSMFVEWMYYGGYTTSGLDFTTNPDAQAWVLGDKLMSTPFKNYAMGRLYDAHKIDKLFSTSVTADAVTFVCDNTVEGAKLRQFYIDFVVTHFSNPSKVLGNIEEWDSVMVDFDDVRTALFKALRSNNQLSRVGTKNSYLEGTGPAILKNSAQKDIVSENLKVVS